MPELDDRLGLVAEHYRETFGHQREYIQKRDQLFVYALLSAIALAFRASYTDQSEHVLTVVVEKVLGSGVAIESAFLGILIWFIFFALIARYFQATLNVERQYEYISRVEQEMTSLYGSDLFAREGKQYLANFPVFGGWMHWIYSWVFPIAILALTIWNFRVDVGHREGWPAFIIGSIALLTSVTVGVYLYSTKFQFGAPWKKKASSRVPTKT
jgi:hypothetical protein